MAVASYFKVIALVAVALAVLGYAEITKAGAGAMPDTENGRYALSPITNGVIRLDTRSGAVSTCIDNGHGWACSIVPDERAAYDTEIGRLQDENEKLKLQLAAREPAASGKPDNPSSKSDLPKLSEPKTADGNRKIEIPRIEIPLPSDRDMDRMTMFLQQAWRRLVDMANRMQKDASGRI